MAAGDTRNGRTRSAAVGGVEATRTTMVAATKEAIIETVEEVETLIVKGDHRLLTMA